MMNGGHHRLEWCPTERAGSSKEYRLEEDSDPFFCVCHLCGIILATEMLGDRMERLMRRLPELQLVLKPDEAIALPMFCSLDHRCLPPNHADRLVDTCE